MRNKLVYKYIGKVLIGFAILLLCPTIVSLIYKENIIPFIVPISVSLLLGIILNNIKNPNCVLE
jgi:Trk-type K+ transport system membrane component